MKLKSGLSVKLPSLSIVIPAYNEKENLEWLVKDMIRECPKYGLKDVEILIVDDGSTDKTGEIADLLSKRFKAVRAIHKQNGGYCSAILRGIKEAKKDYIAYFPADGQTLIEDMVKCLPYLGKVDLILGDRGERRDYSAYRLFISHMNLILIRTFFNNRYKDINWFHIWKRKRIQQLETVSNSVFILAEIVIRFKNRNYQIAEASVPYRSRIRGKAKNANLRVAFQAFRDLIKFWFLLKFGKVT